MSVSVNIKGNKPEKLDFSALHLKVVYLTYRNEDDSFEGYTIAFNGGCIWLDITDDITVFSDNEMHLLSDNYFVATDNNLDLTINP